MSDIRTDTADTITAQLRRDAMQLCYRLRLWLEAQDMACWCAAGASPVAAIADAELEPALGQAASTRPELGERLLTLHSELWPLLRAIEAGRPALASQLRAARGVLATVHDRHDGQQRPAGEGSAVGGEVQLSLAELRACLAEAATIGMQDEEGDKKTAAAKI